MPLVSPLVSLAIVIVAGGWLVAVSLLMAFRPSYCSHLFGVMSARLKASDWRLNVVEQALRLVAGAALILRSPFAKMPCPLWVFGWMIVGSSIIILVLPVRWHGAFGAWWYDRLTPQTIRLLSPIPLLVGAGLTYLAI